MPTHARDLGLSLVDGALVRQEKPAKARKPISRGKYAPRASKDVKAGKTLSKFAGLALPTTAKAKKKVPRAKTPEAVIQSQVEAYLTRLDLDFFHVPEFVLNAAFGWNPHRTGPEFYAMKNASQDIKGFPDLMITSRKHYGLVLWIELKTETGKEKSGQKEWARKVGTHLCRSTEEAKAVIDAWVKGLP